MFYNEFNTRALTEAERAAYAAGVDTVVMGVKVVYVAGAGYRVAHW